MKSQEPFAACGKCKKTWMDLEQLVHDPDVFLNGYQACLPNPDEGLLLWTHNTPSCKTTFSIAVGKFRHLYHGVIPAQRLYGTSECLQLCEDEHNLKPCNKPCQLAWIRDVVRSLRTRQRRHRLQESITE